MTNALANALSPYLRQHAQNPVDWRVWGSEAFEEAKRREVPLFISIGYATCHWCHVMARESFSDPSIAKLLNENFVSIKVDREEHPEVDSAYLTMASAFTPSLGWPLNVFVTPQGRAFFAGTYWPPEAMRGHPSFRQVLERVIEAWRDRRGELEETADAVVAALAEHSVRSSAKLPNFEQLKATVETLERQEDPQFHGFGMAPKFPQVPALNFLLTMGTSDAEQLAERTLKTMANSHLRDDVEGGFFRYATKRDWTEPHYERMLYDNAQLLESYARIGATEVAQGLVGFLTNVLQLPGGLASAQNSESIVDGFLTEGDYYSLSAEQRAKQQPPELDNKVLTGWNGLAIGALSIAGQRLSRPDWLEFAEDLASRIWRGQRHPDGTLARASLCGEVSAAAAVLEDYGLLAQGLVRLAIATGKVEWAEKAKQLVDLCIPKITQETNGQPALSFSLPSGGDPVVATLGLNAEVDPSEGPYPSGRSALADSARMLYSLGADRRYLEAAIREMERVAQLAIQHPLSFGGALEVIANLAAENSQLVVVTESVERNSDLAGFASRFEKPGCLSIVVSEEQAREWSNAGFELFTDRTSNGKPTAYFCEDFVCRLPVTDLAALESLL